MRRFVAFMRLVCYSAGLQVLWAVVVGLFGLFVLSLVLLILFGWLCYIGLPFGLGDCLVW